MGQVRPPFRKKFRIAREILARVLVNRPRMLPMDEPFCSLDAQTRLQMQEMLLEPWHDYHMTVLFVAHDVDEALFLSDRVFVLTRPTGRKGASPGERKRPERRRGLRRNR